MNIRTRLWTILTNAYPAYLRWRYGMDIGKNCRISWKARFDTTVNPKGIHIGDNVWILSNAVVLAHDHCRNMKADVYIGKDCVIGINTIVMPGVSIGNQSVIGGGSVVTKNIPSHSIAVGNPAKVIKENISVVNGVIN